MSAFKAWFRSLVFNQENMELSFKQCWDAAIKSKEQNSNSEQQLKAEIAMQARSLELNFNDTTVVRHIAESLRQLSAV